jgi:hypothetical protein
MVATAFLLRDDLAVDYDRYVEHVRWLVDSGCDGVCRNGSLHENQTLTADERARTAAPAADRAAREGRTRRHRSGGAFGERWVVHHRRLPSRAIRYAWLRRPALPARDGDPPGLVRPAAVRYRHLGPARAVARPR